jgi:hypothetical protein
MPPKKKQDASKKTVQKKKQQAIEGQLCIGNGEEITPDRPQNQQTVPALTL